MTDPIDRLLGDALGRAGDLFAAEADHGRLRWSMPDGQRCYERQCGPDLVVTVTGGSTAAVRYHLDDVDGALLQ